MPLIPKDYVCGSCAGGEINRLSQHKDAKDAMAHFCRTVLGTKMVRTSNYVPSTGVPSFGLTASHYVFIAGPENASYRSWATYGTDFAKFIEDKKLGLVATLPKTLNRKYHPGTTCQIWIWQPDQANLEAWWETEFATELNQLAGLQARFKALLGLVMAKKVPTFKIQHHASQPTTKGFQPNSHVGGTIKINSIDSTYNYHSSYSGANYVTSPLKFGDPKLKVGATYFITATDTQTWTLVEDLLDDLKKEK